MHSGKKPQCILVKSDEFENSYSLLYFFLNPVYVAARSLRSLRSKNTVSLLTARSKDFQEAHLQDHSN